MRSWLAMAMLVGAGPLAAQHEDVPTLVQRAVRERARRDTTLGAWRATAEGLVRFASVVRHGGIPVERVIRADELLVEVYGDAPSRSKQVIRAWRDTTFLPNAIIYHRDHLGIVANDFGDVLRLGEGDEVADVPHPLTPRGLAHYRFTVEDSLTLRTPQLAGWWRVWAWTIWACGFALCAASWFGSVPAIMVTTGLMMTLFCPFAAALRWKLA